MLWYLQKIYPTELMFVERSDMLLLWIKTCERRRMVHARVLDPICCNHCSYYYVPADNYRCSSNLVLKIFFDTLKSLQNSPSHHEN
jgi:hypothetical protein